MEFVCDDLPQHGLSLIPPSSPDYDPLLRDIQKRWDEPVEGAPPIPAEFRERIFEEDRPTSAILLNRSSKAIAGLHVVWHFETVTGRRFRHSIGMLSPQGLLIPLGNPNPRWVKIYSYWHTILPGSKRYIGSSGMVGDNTDVRAPSDEEQWHGGIVAGGGRGGGTYREAIQRVTLVLDGVFFLDGEFVGVNAEKPFERVVGEAEAYRMVSSVAQTAQGRGLTAGQILKEVATLTGPAPRQPEVNPGLQNGQATLEDFRRAALGRIAFLLAGQRKAGADDSKQVDLVMQWVGGTPVNFRRG